VRREGVTAGRTIELYSSLCPSRCGSPVQSLSSWHHALRKCLPSSPDRTALGPTPGALSHLEGSLDEVMGKMGLGREPMQHGAFQEWEQEEAGGGGTEEWEGDEASWAETESEVLHHLKVKHGGVVEGDSLDGGPRGEAQRVYHCDELVKSGSSSWAYDIHVTALNANTLHSQSTPSLAILLSFTTEFGTCDCVPGAANPSHFSVSNH
jgi:hypothetical protein